MSGRRLEPCGHEMDRQGQTKDIQEIENHHGHGIAQTAGRRRAEGNVAHGQVRRAEEGPAGGHFVYVSRTRADIRPSGFNFFERLLLRRLVEGRLTAQLQWLRETLEPPRSSAAAGRGGSRR